MNVVQLKGAREAPKAICSRMDTLLLTPGIVQDWQIPSCQRPLRVNAKVRAIAEELRHNGGVVEGVISLAQVGTSNIYYLFDGQHRREAALISGLPEFYADVRICHYDTMAEMALAFVRLNTAIARMTPDDVLRGLETSLPLLGDIRAQCPFVGYSNIRRSTESPCLSMSAALRCWVGSRTETPSLTVTGKGVADMASELNTDECRDLIRFLQAARAAWGADLENARLWGNINLCMMMWLWRQLVLRKGGGLKKAIVLSTADFTRCLMSLSASNDYIDWLLGRKLSERDRTACYSRIKTIFAARLRADGHAKPMFPQPSWAA